MSVEDTKEDVIPEEKRTSKFRVKLEEFTFRSPLISPVRRSLRSSVYASNYQESSQSASETSNSVTKKRAVPIVDAESPTKSKKKRGYAPPETYSHLKNLADCLGEYLDVLFCGINPGVHSATVGHHFAHPGNRFYKMLHGSGFTERLIPPEDDGTLPALYNIGITDIVDRPSSCEDELSAEEMIKSVPTLLQKVTKYKPRFVCFIGKGMSQKVEKGLKRAIGTNRTASLVRIGETDGIWKTASLKKKGMRPTVPNSQKAAITSCMDKGIGLRPFKVTHPDASSPIRETLFFVSHSSSGLATSMNLQAKTDVLKELRELVAMHKAGTLDTSLMEEVPVLKE